MFAKHPVTSTCIDNSSGCALQSSSVLTQTSRASAARAGCVGWELGWVLGSSALHVTSAPVLSTVLGSQIHFPAQKLLVTLGLGTV